MRVVSPEENSDGGEKPVEFKPTSLFLILWYWRNSCPTESILWAKVFTLTGQFLRSKPDKAFNKSTIILSCSVLKWWWPKEKVDPNLLLHCLHFKTTTACADCKMPFLELPSTWKKFSRQSLQRDSWSKRWNTSLKGLFLVLDQALHGAKYCTLVNWDLAP